MFKQKGTWKLWSDLVRRQEPEVNQHGVQVATVDSARYSYLVEMHIKVHPLTAFELNNLHLFQIMLNETNSLFLVWKECNARGTISYG